MTIAALHLRRSLGLAALPALGLVIAAHLLLRDAPWVREWLWAFDSYHFVTVLLGPVAAGIGAWEGARLAAAQPLLAATGSRLRAITALWAALFAWVAGAYLAGLAAASIWAATAGAPGLPGLVTLGTVFPALGLMAFLSAIGVAAGWVSRRVLAAPLVAIAVFVAVLFSYISVPGLLAQVGGATASLIGLQPRLEVQVAQVALYLVGTALALLAAADAGRVARELTRPRAVAGALVLLAVLAVIVLGGRRFDAQPVAMTCDDAPTPICLAPGYADQAAELRAAFDPYLVALADAGAPPLLRLSQDPNDVADGVGEIPPFVVDRETAIGSLMDAYVPESCDIFKDEATYTEYSGLVYWMTSLTERQLPFDPTVPEVLRAGDRTAAGAWAAGALERMAACGA